MLIQAIEIANGEKVDRFEGDYPDKHITDLQVGTKIPLELNRRVIGEYEIVEMTEKRKIDVPYLELILRRMS